MTLTTRRPGSRGLCENRNQPRNLENRSRLPQRGRNRSRGRCCSVGRGPCAGAAARPRGRRPGHLQTPARRGAGPGAARPRSARLHRARLQTRAGTRRGGGPALALRLPPAGRGGGRFQGRRPTASCGGPVGTVTCRPAEASPGKVGPRPRGQGPGLRDCHHVGRGLADRVSLRLSLRLSLRRSPHRPQPPRAPRAQASPGRRARELEGGAEFGRRCRQVAAPVLGGRRGRSFPRPPWRPPAASWCLAPTRTVAATVPPALPRRPRLAERLGVRAPAPPSKAGEGARQDRPGRPGARRVALKC